MKQILKTFNNLIKKTIFKVWNKTNINLNFNNLNLIKRFNKSIEKTILKVQNKTSNTLLSLKTKNKSSNNLLISKFNKYLITFISLLFIYLFYLSIPILYDKTWLQANIENQLLKEFKINFSTSSDLSYRILPSPHFLIKDSKIFKEDGDKLISLAEIKTLKVFISQKNFFNKEKITVKYLKIDNANFLLSKNDLRLLKNISNNKYSKKKIEVKKSNIFFKDNSDETIAIIKISKAFLFQDDEKVLNLFNLKGEVFNIPFSFDFKKKFNFLKTEEINIIAKTLKLKIFDIYNDGEDIINSGNNMISILNSTINTNYKIKDGITTFNSVNSRINNTKIDYSGELAINPFDLNLNINIDNFRLLKLFNINLLLTELIKTELLFNNNISVNASITANSYLQKEIFQNAKINFNIINGKINLNKTKLINKKIGLLELENSNLSFENNGLTLNTDIMIDINNSDKLFSLLQTNKKFRKPVKNILINLNYDFLTNQIKFNNFKIDKKEVSNELLRVLNNFNDNNQNNWNKSRRLINAIFEIYEG